MDCGLPAYRFFLCTDDLVTLINKTFSLYLAYLVFNPYPAIPVLYHFLNF